MVFYFTAKDGTMIYMGKDKFENEELIKFGWPEDIWFHVDNLSSAHVYVRNPPGTSTGMDGLTDDVIRDCCQLVKENSIEGCKKASVTIVYTPWSNLKKTGGMEVGQVGYHNERLVRKYNVLEKDKDTLRRIEKTRDERHPDLRAERETRDKEERDKAKAETKAKAAADKDLAETRRAEKESRSYDRLFKKGPGGRERETGEADLAGDFGGMGLGSKVKATTDSSAAKAVEEDFM